MRKIICYEGKTYPHLLHTLAPGSVKWEEDKELPVTFNFNHEKVYAKASDFRREEDGAITAEITFVDHVPEAERKLLVDECSATIYANGVVSKYDFVHSCDLQGVSFVLKGSVGW